MPTKLLLAGYFGCGNLGDDAILLGFTEHLKRSEYDVAVLSGFPEETFGLYGLHSYPRKDMKAVRKAISDTDVLVFPGGSVFQDVTSVRSVAYYSNLVKLAKKEGKRVAMLAQGVGPLRKFLGKRLAGAAYGAADLVTVRDPGSAAALKSLGVKKKVFVTADMAFLLPKPVEMENVQNFAVGDMSTVGLAPRPFKGAEVVELFSELSRLLFKANLMPVLIEMDRNEDGPLILEISKHQGGKIPDIRKMQSPTHLQQRLTRMDGMIAMRLHAGVLASLVGVPSMMLNYDPKVAAFAKLMELGHAPDVKGLTAQRLFDQYMEFRKHHDQHVKTVERKVEEMSKLALQNIELFEKTFRPNAKI